MNSLEESVATHRSDWLNSDPARLVAHIVARYHDRHREQLPELVQLAHRIERVHAAHADCPEGLAEHLAGMQQQLESHMRKEEQVLFPLLSRGLRDSAHGPIAVMRFEHEQHGEALDRLAQLTGGLQLPEGACNSWRRLYAGLAELRDDLVAHIALENEILFKETTASEASRG